jgi:L,D-transpeptidase catalytic domain/Putative peptidoglycan binding domain
VLTLHLARSRHNIRGVRRLGFLILLAALGIGAAAPGAGKAPAIVQPGVSVGDVYVGGLLSEQARARLRWAYSRPLTLTFGTRRWRLPAGLLGAAVDADRGVTDALEATRGQRVRARVHIDGARIRSYVRALDKRFSYDAHDAYAYLAGLTPQIAEGKPGLSILTDVTARRIARALGSGTQRKVQVAWRVVEPSVTAADFGPVIVIRRGLNRLYLYGGTQLDRTFKIATGRAEYPTPTGDFAIVDMQRDPWWRPPSSDWAKGLKPIPPGPGNPLGTRWMGLSAPGVGIHGTPDAASVGYSASHGCIRMYVPDAEWLFGHVRIGTPVFIVSA